MNSTKKDKTIERHIKSAKKDLGIARNQSEPRDRPGRVNSDAKTDFGPITADDLPTIRKQT
ncbi:MAG: hypothetical protein CXR30_06435 [Geobacter sp.]|nr:MAG: hypothetical protein CXR30_06435 [Geobacter sp.]